MKIKMMGINIGQLGLALIVFMMAITSLPAAEINTYTFNTPEQEQLYKKLVQELRCLTCQGQNLEGSNGDFARDARAIIYEMITEKQASHDEIVDFMKERFGDSISYKPPVNSSTALLWLGPFLILVVGFVIVFRMAFRKREQAEVRLDDKQRAALRDALKKED